MRENQKAHKVGHDSNLIAVAKKNMTCNNELYVKVGYTEQYEVFILIW